MQDEREAAQTAEYLTEAEAAALLRVGRRSLERWRGSGHGPAWVRMGPRRVLYPRAALVAWASARTHPLRAYPSLHFERALDALHDLSVVQIDESSPSMDAYWKNLTTERLKKAIEALRALGWTILPPDA